MTSPSAFDDQAADENLAVCACSGDCDGAHATKVMIIVTVT